MTTYKGIKGFSIQTVAGDPSNLLTGDIWYDSDGIEIADPDLIAEKSDGKIAPYLMDVTETREDRFVKKFVTDFPGHNILRSAPIMHQIRSIKDPIEIEIMQQACNITEKGFRRILNFIKVGKMEYEIEAELMHEFLCSRSKGFAYTPIIASGSSACVLHYIENNKRCNDGDVILMDFGAEYANYSSDLTRCVPVNGKFTKRQKEVYNAVLSVKNQATKLLKPGIYLNDYHKQVGQIMEEQLIKLKLISINDVKNQDSSWPAYKKYFMHGTSHYIGLDTHDLGSWTEKIKENMVLDKTIGAIIIVVSIIWHLYYTIWILVTPWLETSQDLAHWLKYFPDRYYGLSIPALLLAFIIAVH